MGVSWTVKKDERQRIDAFELWCWRRLLRVPWTARRSNQSILKEISPKYSLEWLMLKLKLQYFGHLMRRANSLEKTLMLGKIEGRRKRGWQDEMVGWHHWLHGHEFEQALGYGEGQGSLVCCSPWGRKESDTTEQLNNKNKNKNIWIRISRLSNVITFLMCVDLSRWAEDLLLHCFELGPQSFPAFGFKLTTETWALLGPPTCQMQIQGLLSVHNHMSQFLTMNFFVCVCVCVCVFKYTSEILQVQLQTTTIKQILK